MTVLATAKGENFTLSATARGVGFVGSDSLSVSVVGPTLSVTKTCEGSAEVRSIGRGTVTVENIGSVPAFGIRVVDHLPAGMVVEKILDSGEAAGGTVIWENIGDLAPGASTAVGFAYRLEKVGRLVNRVSAADLYESATCAGECEVFVVGPPGVTAEVVDAVAGNLDADAFPVGSEFYYRASLLNQGGLPIRANFDIACSEEIARTGVVGETNSTGALVPGTPMEKGDSIDGVTYEFRVWLEPGERKHIRIPARAARATPSRAAWFVLRIRWDVLHPETGARTRHHGELEVRETTWITGG